MTEYAIMAICIISLIGSTGFLFITRWTYREHRFKLAEKKLKAKVEIAKAKEKVPTASEREWIEKQWIHKREIYYLIIAGVLVILGVGGITVAEAASDWMAGMLGSQPTCAESAAEAIDTPWGKFAPGAACMAIGLLMLGHKTIVAIAKARKRD